MVIYLLVDIFFKENLVEKEKKDRKDYQADPLEYSRIFLTGK